jgi:predicted NAD-dependent protein-ADP-ribosyltransferase YbiA (DUF1768 family)
MRVILKKGMLVLSVENEAERADFAVWREAAKGHVFVFDGGSSKGGALFDIGVREEACREPINIVYTNGDQWQLISNLAETPFVLDGRSYASVEGFWQGLKADSERERRRIAGLSGLAARRAGRQFPQPESFQYDDKTYLAGGPDHRALMARACLAKFNQALLARETLLATGERPLIHRARRDSAMIPGTLLAEIWMCIRSRLRHQDIGVDRPLSAEE